jgi:hypothetical protein
MKMKIDGVKWTPLKGQFIPLESAIAQMLLRLKVKDFDSCYKDYSTSTGNVESIRVYNDFDISKYAIDMQKHINALEDYCKPLVLSIATSIGANKQSSGNSPVENIGSHSRNLCLALYMSTGLFYILPESYCRNFGRNIGSDSRKIYSYRRAAGERKERYVFLSEFLFFYRGATNIGSSPVEI